MKNAEQVVRVGVGSIIMRSGALLLMRRAQPHGLGTWSTPGGYFDFGEKPEDCAAREVREEVGLRVSGFRFVALTNDLFNTGRHFITIWMAASLAENADATLACSSEVAEVDWFRIDGLPSPLFLPFEQLIQGRCYPESVSRQSFAEFLDAVLENP